MYQYRILCFVVKPNFCEYDHTDRFNVDHVLRVYRYTRMFQGNENKNRTHFIADESYTVFPLFDAPFILNS
jgi:hypothetical protein